MSRIIGLLGKRPALLALAVVLLATPLRPALSASLTTAQQVRLQSAMARYIDQHSVGDAYLHVDLATGVLKKYYPAIQHPMIVQLKDVLILCADLRDESGKAVNIDFYAMPHGDDYTIFQAELGNRAPLDSLVMKGIAAMLQ